MNNDVLKMSIITTIQTMTRDYPFAYLWDLSYSSLEEIRDKAIQDYNKELEK